MSFMSEVKSIFLAVRKVEEFSKGLAGFPNFSKIPLANASSSGIMSMSGSRPFQICSKLSTNSRVGLSALFQEKLNCISSTLYKPPIVSFRLPVPAITFPFESLKIIRF